MNENEEKQDLEFVERAKLLRKIRCSGVSIISLFLLVIGVILYVIPYFFDMPIFQVEALGIKTTIELEHLSSENYRTFMIGFGVPIILMLIGCVIESQTLNNDWKQKKNRFIFSIICYAVSIIIFAICLNLAREENIDAGIIESSVRYDLGRGAVMMIFGIIMMAAPCMIKDAILYFVAQGRVSEKIFDFRFGFNANKYIQTEYKALTDKHLETVGFESKENRSLTDKLTELMKLKTDGIITEEEFQSKKEELLKKYE